MILQCKATLAFIRHKSVMLYIQPQRELFIIVLVVTLVDEFFIIV